MVSISDSLWAVAGPAAGAGSGPGPGPGGAPGAPPGLDGRFLRLPARPGPASGALFSCPPGLPPRPDLPGVWGALPSGSAPAPGAHAPAPRRGSRHPDPRRVRPPGSQEQPQPGPLAAAARRLAGTLSHCFHGSRLRFPAPRHEFWGRFSWRKRAVVRGGWPGPLAVPGSPTTADPLCLASSPFHLPTPSLQAPFFWADPYMLRAPPQPPVLGPTPLSGS